MDKRLRGFAENGYVVVHGALSLAEVTAVNDGIDADNAAHPEHWEPGPRPQGHVAVSCVAPELMHRTEVLDDVVHHPSVVSLVRRILGQGVQVSGLSFLRREPRAVQPTADINGGDPLCLEKKWHREYGGIVEGADRNEFFAPSIQVIYYMDDVDAECHCTSIIPESAETKRHLSKTRDNYSFQPALGSTLTSRTNKWGEGVMRIDDETTAYVDPENPTWMNPFGSEDPRRVGGVDIHAQAGTAVVFNMASYHCGTVRHTQRIRRTLHVMYRQPKPVHSRHALGQEWQSVAAFAAAMPKRPAIGSM